MPFFIKKFKNGYKVCKRDEPKKCFSKKPIPLKNAEKQIRAIGMSEGLKGGYCRCRDYCPCLEGTGKKELNKLLDKNNINFDEYLSIAKKIAKKKGYNPDLLTISNMKSKKLNYNGTNFGSSINNDFIIYSLMAKNGEITKEEAKEHRRRYLARATKIEGDWKKNKESPNSLAVRILWDG